MSAECKKCGFDLDGDFNCHYCAHMDLKTENAKLQAQAQGLVDALELIVRESKAAPWTVEVAREALEQWRKGRAE